MSDFPAGALIVLTLLTAACASNDLQTGSVTSNSSYAAPRVPPMNPDRLIVEQDCRQPVLTHGGNLRCI